MKITELGSEHLGEHVRVAFEVGERVVEGTLSLVTHGADLIRDTEFGDPTDHYVLGRQFTTLCVGGFDLNRIYEDVATVEVLS